MSEKDTTPAFPMPANEYAGHGPCWGMTLRDYFAAKALNGMNSNPDLMEYVTSGRLSYETAFDRMAKRSYEQADAMLKARDN